MYYGLNPAARLRKEKPCVVLFSTEATGSLRYIHPVYAMVLALCNGQRQEAELLERLKGSLTSAIDAGEVFRKILDAGAPFLDASPEPFNGSSRYDPDDLLYRPEGDPHLRRLSAPIDVAWLVTERCPYDCAYCCIRTAPAHPVSSGELSTEQAFRFLKDCVESGVQSVTFHGGEPFLRRDLPDLIAFLLRSGVRASTSTKLRLSESIVARLAESGLQELQVSLDSAAPGTADDLVGCQGYLAKALHNIELLQRHGIQPKVNAVVTSRNVADIPDLLRAVAARGVRRVSLAGYLRGAWKHDDDLLPGAAALRAMAEEVRRLTAEELPDVTVDMCPLADPRDLSLTRSEYSSCSGGKTGLVVGQDGRVSLCDRLLPFPEAIVGNVTESSLLEIWDGERLRAFVEPEDSAYGGTECQDCGLRPMCDRRIRCYYRSLLVNGHLFGPDYLCAEMPPPEMRFF